VWFDETRAVTALPIGDDDFLLSDKFWKQNSVTANG
jgi:hypothetical protein